MSVKKRSTPSQRKRSRADEGENIADNTKKKEDKRQDAASKRHNNDYKRASPGAYKQLLYGASVLVVAIVAGFLWNVLDTSTDPRIIRFWSQTCRVAQCARFVTPVRRTLQAARPIRAGEIVAEIPRSLQIWDLDALRDDFVQRQLFPARHARTGNLLPSGAFLAAYLALKYHQLIQAELDNSTTATTDEEENTFMDPARKAYFASLPTREELSDHPLFWTQEELIESLGPQSHNMAVASAYQEMVHSEYQAFAEASSDFASTISEIEYTVGRTWVLTRSFSPGPMGPQLELLDEDERAFFSANVATDFARGCHAMVPILDLLNHHPTPNVAYSYNTDKRAFVITAQRSIPSSFELYDSYGKYTDAHLFAKFGFNNGDGSGYTEASIALFHRMLDYQMGDEFSYFSSSSTNSESFHMIQAAQRKGLLRYLQFDDGYQECIPGPDAADPGAWELKELKFSHLNRIANDGSKWVLRVPPRSPKSRPVASSQESILDGPPEIDVRAIRMNIMPLIETCRLMSVIHTDFDGNAIKILRDNLEAPDFVLERGNDALEYRAFMW